MTTTEKSGAPVDEIEVTPEMIRAGTRALSFYNSEIEGPEDLVPRVFRAMWAAREPASVLRDLEVHS
jgi:hypothetical protein